MSPSDTPSPSPAVPTHSPAQQVFDEIYRHATWAKNSQGAGSSGTGSTLKSTYLYRAFLQQFLKENGIRSVVDAGCGDWEFSQTIDWSGIDYKGFDIVDSVIAENRKKFAKPNIQFFAGSIVNLDLPPADLLISKHVLQHLPTGDVIKFLSQRTKFKHLLLTNCVNVETLSAKNKDIIVGDGRALDPTKPPFDLRGLKVLTYSDGINMHQVVHAAGAGRAPQQPKSAHGLTESEAIARIKSHGFSSPTEFKKNDQGIWVGKAQKDARVFLVAVDLQGSLLFREAP